MAENQKLALLGGPKTILPEGNDLFHWPIITEEDEAAVLQVLRAGTMSGIEVTQQLEQEIAAWFKVKYALGHNNGTAALHAAFFGCEVGVGDEIISPSLTYWATCLPVLNLGATVVFAEVQPDTLCLDPDDIEHRITERTKAIVVVHYLGHPAEMDRILQIARKYQLKVVEDVSHAHGTRYHGQLAGTFGDVAAYSIMSAKSLAAGEGGMLMTNDRKIFERAIAFGHYERFKPEQITETALKPFTGLPLGGFKYRMHQLTSALARVQLKHYTARMTEIQQALNYFWDCLKDVPGLRPHRPPSDSGSTMGGWYAVRGHYLPEELGGLQVSRFVAALRAEGVNASAGANFPLHLHPLFNTCDVYGHGKPTRLAHVSRDLRQGMGSLPVTERLPERLITIPEFKHFYPEMIAAYALAYRKVAENFQQLL